MLPTTLTSTKLLLLTALLTTKLKLTKLLIDAYSTAPNISDNDRPDENCIDAYRTVDADSTAANRTID